MRKILMTMTITSALLTITATTAFAAGWQNSNNRWWYATNEDNSVWYTNTWQWIDNNGDGIAECYYFDENGYMLTDTQAPDGNTVNADGLWTVNGVVQTKAIQSQEAQTAQTDAPQLNGLYFDTNWNTYYFLHTLEDGSLQVLHRNADGSEGGVYMVMAYQGNGEWNDDPSTPFGNHARLTEHGVHISMGGYMQRELVAQ